MKEAMEKLDAERANMWHEIGLEMQRAFEEPRQIIETGKLRNLAN